MYRLLFTTVLRRLDPETAHHLTIRALRVLCRVPWVLWVLRRVLRPDPSIAVDALGQRFPSPLGFAAGFDKDAEVFPALTALGFGHVEVGTITALAQPGNPRPRMARLVADRALVNRMGFNNGGAAAAAARLRARRPDDGIVAGNIGKSRAVDVADAVADHVVSATAIAPWVDHLVVNVSSPNTPGLRELQRVDALREVLLAVRAAADAAAHRRVPLLVKIAPDLTDEQVDEIADLALALGLAGIVATNTTVARDGLRSPAAVVEAAGPGGLSGAPLAARSLAVLQRLHDRVGDRLVLVSVGGVSSADDVRARLAAGATLVQAYSAVVYGGPLWAWHVNRSLARRPLHEA